jgi:hypothetical protein
MNGWGVCYYLVAWERHYEFLNGIGKLIFLCCAEADRIRKEYQEADDKLRSIVRKISELEGRTKQDFGKAYAHWYASDFSDMEYL